MKRLAAILLVCSSLIKTARAEDVGYWPEIPTPKITTFAQMKKYEDARKTSLTASILGAVAAGVLITYAGQVDRKADRVVLISDQKYMSPGGYMLNVQRPEQFEFQRRLRSKADVHRTIGTVFALASILGFSLSMSLRF